MEFKIERVIGCKEEDVIAELDARSLKHRIVHRDGKSFIVTRDFRIDRVNLTILDGVVCKAYLG